jgi:hypothetical protein
LRIINYAELERHPILDLLFQVFLFAAHFAAFQPLKVGSTGS